MKKILCIVLFFVIGDVSFAGNADKDKANSKLIAGKITNLHGEAVAGAKIIVVETGETFFADFDGNFKLSVKLDKEYSISINTIGYNPLELKSTQLSTFSSLSLQELN